MGFAVLKDVLERLSETDIEDTVFISETVPKEGADFDTPVVVVRCDPDSPLPRPPGMKYFLDACVMLEVVEGLEHQLGRRPSLAEQAVAIRHYAEHDAYISLEQLAVQQRILGFRIDAG